MSLEAKLLPLIVRDYFGRSLEEGDEVFVALKGPILFRVVAIRPNMDPNQPPNLVHVELAASAMLLTQREAAVKELIRTRTVAEAGPSHFQPVEAPKGQA